MNYKILNVAILSTALFFGCKMETKGDEIPATPPTKTRPNIRKAPKTMLCKYEDRPVVIAIIDTGFSTNQYTKGAKLCKFGHKNYTGDTEMAKIEGVEDLVPTDSHGHGTNIAGLIQEHAENSYYCMVIIRYWSPKAKDDNNLRNTVRAINYAINIKADYINYSGGGTTYSAIEAKTVKRFLDAGGRFIAAAGNERSDLSVVPYYPAMDDDRVIVVGNKDADGNIVRSSNYGSRVNRWENGVSQSGFGITMTGTSQAAAIASGKIINETECDK